MTRKIAFVTGGAGFIGSNVVARLAKDWELDVVVCDWLGQVEDGKWRNIAKHPIGDFCAPEQMFDWLGKRWQEVEVVIHMGAVSSTTEADADKIVHANFALSRDLFRWCTDFQRRLIYASSAATYGDGSEGMDDVDPRQIARLQPLNAYGRSKQEFDLYAWQNRMLDHMIGLKYFNVFGPNEYHKGDMRSVVIRAYQQIRDTRRVKLFRSYRPEYRDGEQVRDFLYVKDAVAITLHLAGLPAATAAGLFNVGSGEAHSWNDLAGSVFRAMGEDVAIDYVDMPEAIRERYQYATKANIGKLLGTGYRARITPLGDAVHDYVVKYLATNEVLGGMGTQR
jgi:ADP-L-glycero-D-manno-heptose 6-epimerase